MKRLLYTSCLLLIIAAVSCNKTDTKPPDPCASVNIPINHTHTESIGTSNNGTITILEPRGDTISYSLNNGNFGTSWYFNNLAPGNYVVTVKNQKGCTDTARINVLNYGPKYYLVKQIIIGYCGPCHLNGGNDGGKNWDTDESIINNWQLIKQRAVDNIPSAMPPAPNSPLTPVDKQKITDWVNAGHRISD